MELNWIFEVYVMIIALIAFIITFTIQLKHYLRTRYIASLYWAEFNFSIVLFYGFIIVAELFLSEVLLRISILCFIPFTFTLGLFSDTLQQDRIDPKKQAVFGILAGAMIVCSFLPDASVTKLNIMGDPIVEWAGWFKIIASVSNLIAILLLASFVFNTYRKTRQYPDLQRPANMLILSVVMYFVSQIFGMIPMLGYQIFQIIGVSIIAYTYQYYPKLYYILPFKALRLIVINNNSGIPIFTYTWNSGRAIIDETLFSGMIQAIGTIIKESLNHGDVQEVRLTKGVLLIQSNEQYPISCALASTKSSKILQDSLSNFHLRFVKKFAELIDKTDDVSKFDSAKSIVESSFSFIPD